MISERKSKSIFFIESVLITAPASAVCLVLAVIGLVEVGQPTVAVLSKWSTLEPYFILEELTLLGAAIGFCATCAAIYLSIRFLRFGRQRLAVTSSVWWYLADAGVLLSVLGVICLLHRSANLDLNMFALFAFGFPMIIPFGHLQWERNQTHKLQPLGT